MDLNNFKRRVERNKYALTKFLQKLDEIVPEDMPELVAKADAEVWKKVDCQSCANCCKTMTPTYSAKDIRRISAHFGMTPKAFKSKWLQQDTENGDWVNREVPCQFLQSDNRCGIYEIRPADCAEFPHHHKKPFDEYNETFIGNLTRCPATLELVQRLKRVVERDYEF